MSKLYDEALADAKKIQELAVQDAQKKILEQITPVIRKAISNDIATGKLLSEQEELSFDETEDTVTPDLSAPVDAPLDASADVPTDASAPLDATPLDAAPTPDALGDTSSAPIAVDGSQDLSGMALPDEDGKIVVDFDQLFVQTDDDDPEALPSSVDASSLAVAPSMPVAPDASMEAPAEEGTEGMPAADDFVEEEPQPALQPEAVSYDKYKTQLAEVSSKIDRVFFRKQTPSIVYESLKTQLFSLMESLDTLSESGKIERKQIKNEENKLEFLHLKLKEAKSSNTYGEEKGNVMTTLKEMAAKLFEEVSLAQDTESTGDAGVPVLEDETEHAQSVDGADNVDLMKEEDSTNSDLETAGDPFAEDPTREPSAQTESDPVQDDMGDALSLETMAEGTVFEVDEKELREALRKLRKENIARLRRALREGDEGGYAMDLNWEEGGEKIGHDDPKKIAMAEQYDTMEGDLSIDIEHDPDTDEPGEDELLLTVNGMDLDLSDMDDMDDEMGLDSDDVVVAGDDMGDDDVELDVVDDEGDAELLYDEELVEAVRRKVMSRIKKLAESTQRKPQARKPAPRQPAKPTSHKPASAVAAKKALLEKRMLEKKLQEERFMTAKLVYANRLFAREDVTKAQKVRIAEFLDSAKSLAEAKDVYLKVEKVLNEKASKGQKMSGSTSQATAKGSATTALRESVSHTNEPVLGSVERWQVLANIKKKSND